MDVDESQEANVKGNQAANDVRKTLPRASYRKEPYMDDSCKLSVRGLAYDSLLLFLLGGLGEGAS